MPTCPPPLPLCHSSHQWEKGLRRGAPPTSPGDRRAHVLAKALQVAKSNHKSDMAPAPYRPPDKPLKTGTPLPSLPMMGDPLMDGNMFPTEFLEGVPIPQRLAQCADFWRDVLHAPEATVKGITEGWPVPWRNGVKPVSYRTPISPRRRPSSCGTSR